MRFSSALLAIFVVVMVPLAGFAHDVPDRRIKDLVAQTLREHPALVLEALQTLEQRQSEPEAAAQAAALSIERAALERDPNAPVLGNPDRDVTVVEFFDYNCPSRKRVMPELDALLSEDGKVRRVMRELPILGEGSVFAARAALASRNKGKYADLHNALMGMRGRVEANTDLRVAAEIGPDVEKLKADMRSPEVDEHIATSMRLAKALGFSGIPSFVVGDQLVPGFVEKAQLVTTVAAARKVK